MPVRRIFFRRAADRVIRAIWTQPNREPVQQTTEAELRHADFMIGFSTGAFAVLFAIVLVLTFWRSPAC